MMTPPKAGETWLCNNESSELTIIAFDDLTGDVWVRFHNTGENKVYARNRWERWVKKPEFTLPPAPRLIFSVYRTAPSGQLSRCTTITDESPNWRTRLKPYMRPGSRYKVTLLRQSARHGSPGRYDWYTADDFQDDCLDEDDDDC